MSSCGWVRGGGRVHGAKCQCFVEEWEHYPVIGRIGYPGDRTVRYTQGEYTATLSIKMANGALYDFRGEEAEGIALILATEIP